MKPWTARCLAAAILMTSGTVLAQTSAQSRAQEFRAEQISRIVAPRATVNSLNNKVVTQPVTVQGKGPATVVTGNAVVNKGRALESAIRVKCPNAGHRVIVKDNLIVNSGRITSTVAGGNASMLEITCPKSGTITVDQNRIVNSGTISSR